MKRTFGFGMGLLAMAGLLATAAAAQSLGDYARQQRAQKPATPAGEKVYTNDNLPISGMISEVGQPAPAPAPVSAKAAAAAERAEQGKTEELKGLEAQWRAKFTEQKKNIAEAQQELDTLVRESDLRRFQERADLNAEANHPAQSVAEAQKDQAGIAEKQQALDAAKQRLEDMKQELHKAGLPASWAD